MCKISWWCISFFLDLVFTLMVTYILALYLVAPPIRLARLIEAYAELMKNNPRGPNSQIIDSIILSLVTFAIGGIAIILKIVLDFILRCFSFNGALQESGNLQGVELAQQGNGDLQSQEAQPQFDFNTFPLPVVKEEDEEEAEYSLSQSTNEGDGKLRK